MSDMWKGSENIVRCCGCNVTEDLQRDEGGGGSYDDEIKKGLEEMHET